MRGHGRVSGVLDPVASGFYAQRRTQEMLANWGQDPAQEAAKLAEKKRLEQLRKMTETRQIKEYIDELREKEETQRRKQAPIIEAQRKESERLAMIERERVRHDRLSQENQSFRAQLAKEQAEAKAKAQAQAQAQQRREAEAKLLQTTELRKRKREEDQDNFLSTSWNSVAQWASSLTSNSVGPFSLPNPFASIASKPPAKKDLHTQIVESSQQKPELKVERPLKKQKTTVLSSGSSEIRRGESKAPVAIPSTVQSPKIKASQYYSHNQDICRLQEKFDNHNNISYKQIQNNKDYFDKRVAKWDAELKGLHLETSPPRKKNEPRKMGFDGYLEYLDGNIEKLKRKELTKEELQIEKTPSVNQDQLKTLIAFHYLEKTKAIYSSGKFYLEGIQGDCAKKEIVFEKVPKEYRSFLFDKKFQISQNSYTLPNIIREASAEIPQFSSQSNKPPAISVRVASSINSFMENAVDSASEDVLLIKNRIKDKEKLVEGVKAVESRIKGVGEAFKIGLRNASSLIQSTGTRAAPNKNTVSKEKVIDTESGLGYRIIGSDVRSHDLYLRRLQDINSKLGRDTQPEALLKNLNERRDRRYCNTDNQAKGGNFHGLYNNRHGGR